MDLASRGSGFRQQLLVVLSLLVLLLSVDVLGLIGANDSKSSDSVVMPPSTLAAWSAMDADARQLLAKEHEGVVAEIRLRIEQEHLLFALKFVLVGAILGTFLQTAFRNPDAEFERTPFAALAAWAAVVAAAIVDLRLMSNQTFLMTLGGWTRQYEQLTLGSKSASLGWEAYIADTLFNRSHYPALRISGQILTVLLFCFTAALFLARPDADNSVLTARISGAGAIVAIAIMTMAAISIRRDPLAIFIYLAAGALATLVAGLMAKASAG